MTTNEIKEQRRAAFYAAEQAERNAQHNLQYATINRQWHEMKLRHPDAVLMFRVGDFYEILGEDAVATSEVLGLVVTRRDSSNGVLATVCSFPYHALDTYLPKLIRAGHRVAICEQLETPKPTIKR